MKNITLALDDQTYRRARIRAAEQNTSVSALVKQLLISTVQEPGRETPSATLLELAAELRELTSGRKQSPAEQLQSEGPAER